MSTWFPPRWPVEDPDLIQLYTMNTPNGQKVGICLEEMGVPYEVHAIDINKGDQHDPEYLKLNPNGKIPSLIDPHGPEDEPVYLMESIVILQYLADKTGRFYPRTYRARLEAQQWLTFQVAHIGPMFGQFGHFYKFARSKTTDTYALNRYLNETKRLLKILDTRLQDRDHIMGEYSIVDMAMVPWVDGLTSESGYGAADILEMHNYTHVQGWHGRVTSRPAYRWGKDVGKIS